ncbi:MAG TPA: SpoIID/LytB domain-containing protein [Bacteroidetes bacterium]|nr:SpoIID/LytB domain-containing protein [Bacteroidota bacterium]
MTPSQQAAETTKSPVEEKRGSLAPRVIQGRQPLVRVGLLEGYDHVDFRIRGAFNLTTIDGREIYAGITSDRRWRCRVEEAKPAKYVYSVLVKTLDTEKKADKLAEWLRNNGQPARVLPFGREVQIGKTLIHQGRRWRVIVGAYDREDEVRPLLDKVRTLDGELHPRVLRHRVEDASGRVEVYDAEYDLSAIVPTGFRLIPADENTEFTLYDVRVGAGFSWERLEDHVYRGVIEIRVDHTANLLALNELLLDDYLKGVIPSEMHPSYPMEALKAQAVAARSYTVAKLASRPANDPIDFPATVMFQVYSGVTKEDEATTRAVLETSGEVLKSGSRVCEAYFCANSGGHTESKEYWNPPGEDYLVGRPVMSPKNTRAFNLDLRKEVDVEKWVQSHPESYSNPRGTNIDILNRNARYFRWEVTYPRPELEEIIRRKLGFDIGTLIDIQPLRRGVSGRIIELEILGTLRNHKVRGELAIRRVLSETTLNSSCFIVKLVMGDIGNPVEITFVGAGFGHGVGMDQTAAGVMAVERMKYPNILKRFYKGARIEKIW